MHNTILIGFSGKIGSGKNYIAEQIFVPTLIDNIKHQYNNTLIVPYYFSFGDHLKVECLCRNSYESLSDIDGYYNFFTEKTKETRDILQKYGTENGRDKYHENIWIRAVDTWIKIQLDRLQKTKLNTLAIIIISDVRFENELKYIEDNRGIIIRIDAPDRTMKRIQQESNGDYQIKSKIQSHASEISLDNYDFEYVINNSYDRPFDDINMEVINIIKKICDIYDENKKFVEIVEEYDNYINNYTEKMENDLVNNYLNI